MQNNLYVWYSSASEDSGKLIAQLLECQQHGTNPPKGFDGTIIAFGAKPTPEFKWQERKIRGILNDPRVIRPLTDRMKLFERLAGAELRVPKLLKLTAELNFATACSHLGTSPALGVAVLKSSGGEAKLAFSDLGIAEARRNGATYVAHSDFLHPTRTRAFIVGGYYIGALQRDNQDNSEFSNAVAAEQSIWSNKEEAQKFILHLVEGGFVRPLKTYWKPLTAINPKLQTTAVAAAAAAGFDLCAVDMAMNDDGEATVLNMVSTPELVSHPQLHPGLTSSLRLWTKRAIRSAKEILTEIAQEANEQEAEAIVAELRKARS